MKKSIKGASRNLFTRTASALVAAQLIGLTSPVQAMEYNLLNSSLPLPELNAQQVERLVRSRQKPQHKDSPVAARPAATRPIKEPLAAPTAETAATTSTTATPSTTGTTATSTSDSPPAAGSEGTRIQINETLLDAAAAPVPTPEAGAPALKVAPGWSSDSEKSSETTPQYPQQYPAQESPESPKVDHATTGSAGITNILSSPIIPQPIGLRAEIKTDAEKTEATKEAMVPAAPLPPGPSEVSLTGHVDESGIIVIDNDQVAEQQSTIDYEDLPTDEGKTRIKTGGRFPVVISSEITSKTAKKGDAVLGRLKYELKIGDRLVARKGAEVHGHVDYVLKARTPMHSLFSPERWYRNSGCIGIKFDEMIGAEGEHIPLLAEPARQALIVKNKGEGRVLGVNHRGQVTGPWSQQLRYKAIRIGMNAAMAPLGTMSFGAMPVALGVIGAVNPSFAFMKPVGLNVRHRRIKGFAWGFLSGIPGSWLIEDTTVKGQEAVIQPGDEFLAEFRQEFTGKPASDAELLPGAATKVHGEVTSELPHSKKKKKK